LLFFGLSTHVLVLILFALMFGATAIGFGLGRSHRDNAEKLREPVAVLQGALLGFMGLVLAFGLSLGVGRYEARRAAVRTEANAIETTYLRAQTLAEPVRTRSLALLEQYADASIRISDTIPGSAAQRTAVAESHRLLRQLWSLAGEALDGAPIASAPRLYVESLNDTFNAQSARVGGLGNRVPSTVLALELLGAAVALGLLAMHLSVLGRGLLTSALAALLVTLALTVTYDLDRPTRGLIQVPDTPLEQVRASMDLPPAASGASAG
jgi:hypothetical protein